MRGCVMLANTNRHVQSWHSSRFEVEGQPSVGVDGSTVACTEVIVGLFSALRNEPVVVAAEVRTHINQELLLIKYP
jgi:hypothetical protein